MPEVINLEPKHLHDPNGNGKGPKRRRGSDLKAYNEGYDRIFGKEEDRKE
jgi:hypothetical protein